MGTSQKIAKNSVFYFIGTGIDIPLSLVGSIVIARALGADAYGTYSFYQLVLVWAGMVINLGWGTVAKRHIAEAMGEGNAEKAGQLAKLVFVGRILPGLLATALIIGLSSQFAHWFHGQPIYFVVTAIMLLPFVLTQTFTAVCMGYQRFQYYAYFIIASTPIRVILSITLVLLGFGALTMLGVYAFSLIIGLAVAIFLLDRIVPLKRLFFGPGLARDDRAAVFKFSVPVAASIFVSYLLWQRSEVFLLGRYSTTSAIGDYSLAQQIPQIAMELVPVMFGTVLIPAVAEQIGRDDMAKVKSIYLISARYLMLLALPIAVILIALAGPIVGVLYGAKYEPVVNLMRIVCFPRATFALLGAGTAVIFGLSRPGFALKVAALLGVLSLGLNFWLIPRYGALGAAIGTSIAEVLMLPIYIWWVERNIKVGWPLVEGLRIVMACVPAGLVMYVISYLLGPFPALFLGLFSGAVLLIVGLVMFGAVRQQDIQRFGGIARLLPTRLSRVYGAFIGLVGILVQARQTLLKGA